jgi:phosphoribosylaminoimidazole-succinocarboxamide synthase
MKTDTARLPDLPKYPLLKESNLEGIECLCRGMVRDVYDLGDHVLLVATDRISVTGIVMDTPIPLKGRVLTEMSAFWFDQTRHIIKNHMVTTDVDAMDVPGYDLKPHREQIAGRSMLARKAEVLPVACVVRGYLYGSGWREYEGGKTVCGKTMRKNMRLGSQLGEPLFTPATQRPEGGRVENISYQKMINLVGKDVAETMREASEEIYDFAARFCQEHELILADTKLEFGMIDGEVHLIDELVTPDSSRLWPTDAYTPGKHQLAFDKQFIRDYLDATGWDGGDPGPELPVKVSHKAAEKYLTAYQQILGRELS